MLGLFTLFSAVLWYLIDILKRALNHFKEAKHFNIHDVVYDVIVWVAAIGGGMLLALQFKLDAFVLVSQLMDKVFEVPNIDPSVTGYIFGGLVLSSGSGFMNGLLKAIGKRPEPIVPEAVLEETFTGDANG